MLDLPGKASSFNLLVPLANPAHGAEALVDSLVPVTGSHILALVGQCLVAPVEVQVVLKAVTCLVGVGEAGVKRSSPVILDLLFNNLRHYA